MAQTTPKVHIAISLSSQTFRFSDPDDAKPTLSVTSTLMTPDVITIDGDGEGRADTILGDRLGFQDKDFKDEFRVELFAFHDVATSETVLHDLFPGSCEPFDFFIELRAGEPRVTRARLHENDPMADPVHWLKPGHQYRITLKPQTVKCWIGGLDEMIARREVVPPAEGEEEVPDAPNYRYSGSLEVRLACDDELVLSVEE